VSNNAVLTFPGLAAGKLPDGNYQLTVLAAGVTSSDGFQLTADYSFNFFVLTGDVNGDRVTNDRDLYLVWQNLLKAPALRNLGQDLDGDGQITNADIAVVKDDYLATLPAPPNFAPSSRIALITVESPAISTTASIGFTETQSSVVSNNEQSPAVVQASSSGVVSAPSNAVEAGIASGTSTTAPVPTAVAAVKLPEFVSNQSVPQLAQFLRPPGARHLDCDRILEWLRPAQGDLFFSLSTRPSDVLLPDRPSETNQSLTWPLPQPNADADDLSTKNVWDRLSRRKSHR